MCIIFCITIETLKGKETQNGKLFCKTSEKRLTLICSL